MASGTILIISRDKDFAQVVAEQVQKQLSLPCQLADSAEAARPLMASALLVVTGEADAGKCPCPVLPVGRPPLRLAALLDDIASAVQKQAAEDTVGLGGGFVLQPRQKQLAHAGNAVGLTDKEIQLLTTIAGAGRRGISKDRLLKDVWGIDAALDTHTLETHIYRLRGKLRELADDDTMIAASDSGYKWMER